MSDRVTVVLERTVNNKLVCSDVEVPLDITANELVLALNSAYKLGIDTENYRKCYLRCERPVLLLRGERTLRSFGLRQGTLIHTGS